MGCVILQHKRHPNRFEAHLEVHVGPVHEEDDEQGIAHMTEHVLLDCESFFQLPGPDSWKAAYTTFNQTVYHITSLHKPYWRQPLENLTRDHLQC
ncbi:stromal processing peptidase, chloroplastic-like [Morus notabilis]|uniref:stromal processing peptidase, chloroplastic-like n=1 Tax=Morus notabilis TaxID=981085 RepID=UPI000CECE552|nr:stromal processing peptidase, chloroplastic-like [Morus notabilis]